MSSVKFYKHSISTSSDLIQYTETNLKSITNNLNRLREDKDTQIKTKVLIIHSV